MFEKIYYFCRVIKRINFKFNIIMKKIIEIEKSRFVSAEEMSNVQGGKRIFTCTEYEMRPCYMFLTCNFEYQNCMDDVFVSCPNNFSSKQPDTSARINLLKNFTFK